MMSFVWNNDLQSAAGGDEDYIVNIHLPIILKYFRYESKQNYTPKTGAFTDTTEITFPPNIRVVGKSVCVRTNCGQ